MLFRSPLPPLAAPPPSAAAAAAAAAPSPGAPILEPNGDWWWHDTHHVAVSDVQIFSSGAVAAAGGVYWMFYSGGSFERHPLPAGITSTAGVNTVESKSVSAAQSTVCNMASFNRPSFSSCTAFSWVTLLGRRKGISLESLN